MAQELREGDGKSGIARAGKRKWGYDPAQVDAFLERAHALYDSEGMNLTQHDIQNVSFDLLKNGYVIDVWNVPWSISRPHGRSHSTGV